MPRKKTSMAVVVAMMASLVMLVGGSAAAVTVSNGCRGVPGAPTEWTGTDVDLTGAAPATVAPGGSVTVTGITQTLSVPGDLFVGGYNLGLLHVGTNTVQGAVTDTIEATNTVEGIQDTNTANVTLSSDISDPDRVPGSGDETATPATVANSFLDMHWTAAASGTIDFREALVYPPFANAAGVRISITLPPVTFSFGCSPGTVTGMGTTFTPATAVPFASTTISTATTAPDASMEAILNGPIRVAAGHKVTIAKVCSVGTDPVTVTDSDITSEGTFNGSTVGDGTFTHLTTGSFTLDPGSCKRFRIDYTYGSNGPVAGDSVIFAHTVSVASDLVVVNNTDSTKGAVAR